ncbi:MAG TPA: DUF92 domain-containing protein [Ktedonobacteraceae bacterium]|nr:DUF92 domain-containing protein [Ktedonobacteraceae bacterium]
MFNKKLPCQRLLLGLLFSTGVGLFAYRRRSLSRSGVAGAMATGSVTVGMGGWSWGLALIYFFVSSSLLSHFRSREKERTAADKFSKGSQRDFLQVIANGGVATALSLAHGLTNSQSTGELLQAGYTGALATANGDTWATELGVLNTRQPRLITTGKPVAPGTSGGITLLGTAASAVGGLSLGLVFWLLQGFRKAPVGAASARLLSLPVIGLLSGLLGSLADSLMGATLQAIYYCPTCEKETERRIHSCGTATLPLRGIAWFDNDVVNFIATLCGALIGIGSHLLLQCNKRTYRDEYSTTHHP